MPVVLSESERLRLEQLLAQDDDLTEGDVSYMTVWVLYIHPSSYSIQG